MRFLLGWLLCCSLYAVEFPIAATGWDKLSEAARTPFVFSEGVVEGVNVVTGTYLEHAVDLTTQGIDPYVLERCYSRDTKRPEIYEDLDCPNLLGWYASYDSCIWYECPQYGDYEDSNMAVSQKSGSFIHYFRPKRTSQYKLGSFQGYMNHTSGILSGQNHLCNSTVECVGKNTYYLYLGDGTIRCFTGKGRFREDSNIYGSLIAWERKPSGNLVVHNGGSFQTLSSDGKTVLNWVRFITKDGGYHWTIESSDNRSYVYFPGKQIYRTIGATALLHQVVKPNGTSICYRYGNHPTKGNDFFLGKDLPEGRFLTVEYAGEKVAALLAPIGVDQTPLAKYRFAYTNGYTDVFDALGNRTRYEYGNEKRIERIVHFQNDIPYRMEKNVWDAKGSLSAKLLMDGSGSIYLARRFIYDDRANVICEKVFGTLTGKTVSPILLDAYFLPIENGVECYTKHYAYSNDRFNLLIRESDSIATTVYTYHPNTNLLKSKCIWDHTAIRLRSFRQYDSLAAVSELIEDDGNTEDPNNLSGCTLRKIVRFTNRMAFPGVGQPEIKEEYYYDFERQQERLLKRILYHYDVHNVCIQEDIFDGEKTFLYSIFRSFDEVGHCVSETDALGNAVKRTFDANGNLIKEVGPRSDVVIENGYDYSNRLIWTKKSDGLGNSRTQRYRYDLCGRKIAEMDVRGNETLYTYDANGREIRITYPEVLDANDFRVSHFVEKAYDVCDNVVLHKDERGDVTRTWFTARGQPYRILRGEAEEKFEYDLRGNLVKKTIEDGSFSLIDYDFLDRIIKTQHFNSQGDLLLETAASYTAFLPISIIDADGTQTTISYDYAGREKKIVKGNACIEKSYDALGFSNEIKQWYGFGENEFTRRRFVCDFLGHILEETIEDSLGTVYNKKKFFYDADSNCIEAIAFLDSSSTASTSFLFDGFKRELERCDPLGNVFKTQYIETSPDGFGGMGSLQRKIDPLFNVTECCYNARGQMIKETVSNASGNVLSHKQFRYDGVGNRVLLKQQQGPDKWQKVFFSFIQGGKIAKIQDQNMQNTFFTYDLKGQLICKQTPLGIHQFTYDPLGRLISHSAHSSEGDVATRYKYDLCGRAVGIEQNGKETLRSYDTNGNLIYEKQESGFEISYAYDRQGRKTSMQLPEATCIFYHYSGPYLHTVDKYVQGKVCYSHSYVKRNLSGQVLEAQLCSKQHMYFHYDLTSKITSISTEAWKQKAEYDPCGNLSLLVSCDVQGESVCGFGYDGLNQMISENDQSYEYDYLGNRQDMEVGPSNQVLKFAQRHFTYDCQGRMLSDQSSICSYDALDRMVSYNQTTYLYDGLNRRVAKNGVYSVYDGNREIGTLNERGELDSFRLLGEGEGAELGATLAIELKGESYTAVADIRGSISCLIDQRGLPTTSYRYAAFGQITVISAAKKGVHPFLCNPWTFHSKRFDEESGFIFYGRRYYMASVGRFTTPDPLGYVDGLNLYTFVHNNPLTHADLYGYRDGKGPLESRSCADFLGKLYRLTMSTIEWIGKNMIPLPGVRDLVESIGRWGAGGKLFTLAEYRESHCQTYVIEGKKIAGETVTWVNGMRNSLEESKEAAKLLAQKLGGVEVIILYNSTHGLITDLIECFLLKLGGISAAEKTIIDFVRITLQNTPNEIIHIHGHSQGGLHLYNAGRQLSKEERGHIEAITFGSAKLIPKEMFEKVVNFVSRADFIPLFDTFNYLKALKGNNDHVIFLSPTYYNPFKEHMITETTYQKAFQEIGMQFQRKYL